MFTYYGVGTVMILSRERKRTKTVPSNIRQILLSRGYIDSCDISDNSDNSDSSEFTREQTSMQEYMQQFV